MKLCQPIKNFWYDVDCLVDAYWQGLEFSLNQEAFLPLKQWNQVSTKRNHESTFLRVQTDIIIFVGSKIILKLLYVISQITRTNEVIQKGFHKIIKIHLKCLMDHLLICWWFVFDIKAHHNPNKNTLINN